MSFELTQKVIRHNLSPLRPNDKLVLAVIADKIDHKGYCYPSIKGLCRITGLSKNAVHAALYNLKYHHLIAVHKTPGAVNQYVVVEDVLDELISMNGAQDLHGSPSQGHPDFPVIGSPLEGHPPVPEKDGGSPSEVQGVSLTGTQVNKQVNKLVTKSSKASPAVTADPFPKMTESIAKANTGFKNLDEAMSNLKIALGIEKSVTKQFDDKADALAGAVLGIDLGKKDSTSVMTAMHLTAQTAGGTFQKLVYALLEQLGEPEDHHDHDFLEHVQKAAPMQQGQSYMLDCHKITPGWHNKVEAFFKQLGYKTDFNIPEMLLKVHYPYPQKTPAPIVYAMPDYSQNPYDKPEVLAMDVADVIAGTKTNTLDLKKGPPNPASIWRDCAVEWRIKYLTTEPESIMIHLTIKEKGMLNQLHKKVGGYYAEIVKKAVGDWKTFVSYANMHTGTNAKPISPNIAYFVKHFEQARMFWHPSKLSDTSVKKLKTLKTGAAKIQQSSKTKQLLKLAKEKKSGVKTKD